MPHKLHLYISALCLALSLSVYPQTIGEDARFSLVTCSPGEELYARYGHTALRVQDEANDIDIVFNYGIFDFNTDHFYWKFVRGETWYELGATPWWWFMREYEETHRPVYEQELNLTPRQCGELWEALVENYRPENRKYLYNFVFDNCATRPYHLIARIVGDTIQSAYTGYTGETYRRFIRHYTGVHTWANAGINLLFGPKADRPMTDAQRFFLPEELMLYMDKATIGDGRAVVSRSSIAPFEPVHTPWYASWEFGWMIYFLLIAAVSYIDRRRGRWSWGVEIAAGIPYVLLLGIVTFLTFFSCHPLVGFGWRLLVIPLTHLCARFIYILR